MIVGRMTFVFELVSCATGNGALDVEIDGLTVTFEKSEVSGLTVFSFSTEGHSRLKIFAIAGCLSSGSRKSNRENEESSEKLAGKVLVPDFFGVSHLFEVGWFCLVYLYSKPARGGCT